MPASSWARSSAYMRDRPSEAASRPGASGARSRPCRVGAAHDRRQAQQRLGGEAQLLDHGVEGAGLAAMAPEHVLDVERRGVEPLRHGRDLGRRHEQEHGSGIDEAADQPRAGDAVDLGPRPRHPDRAAAAVARRQLGRRARAAGRPAPRPRTRRPGPRPARPRAGARRQRLRSASAPAGRR